MAFVLRRREELSVEQLRARLASDPRQAAAAILEAARQGDVEAQALLGQILLDGQGIERDPALAVTWFRIAAERGHAMARNMLGRCLEHGWGVPANPAEAAEHYARAAADYERMGRADDASLLRRLAATDSQIAAARTEWNTRYDARPSTPAAQMIDAMRQAGIIDFDPAGHTAYLACAGGLVAYPVDMSPRTPVLLPGELVAVFFAPNRDRFAALRAGKVQVRYVPTDLVKAPPPGWAVTMYERDVGAASPFSDASQVSVACPSPAIACTFVGASPGPWGVPSTVAPSPSPHSFTAATVNR